MVPESHRTISITSFTYRINNFLYIKIYVINTSIHTRRTRTRCPVPSSPPFPPHVFLFLNAPFPALPSPPNFLLPSLLTSLPLPSFPLKPFFHTFPLPLLSTKAVPLPPSRVPPSHLSLFFPSFPTIPTQAFLRSLPRPSFPT